MEVKTSLFFSGTIKVSGSLRITKSLFAGRYIEAGWGIEAGGGIKAGWGIEAGENWGIYAGLSVRISYKAKHALVVAKKEPKNLLLGAFKRI